MILLVSNASIFAKTTCETNPQIATPLSEEAKKPFFDWANSHKENLDKHFIRTDRIDEIYWIDINNDGRKEMVLTTLEGSGGYLGIYILEKNSDGFNFLADDIPKPASITYDGPWYGFKYRNQLTDKEELFIEICGKIYLSINNGTYKDPIREIFIWEKNETKRVCTTEWANFHRGFFKKLYSKKKYGSAISYLMGVLETCGDEFPKSLKFWMENDVSLAAIKKGDIKKCREILQKIKADKEFQNVDSKFKNAFNYNEKLCLKKAKTKH